MEDVHGLNANPRLGDGREAASPAKETGEVRVTSDETATLPHPLGIRMSGPPEWDSPECLPVKENGMLTMTKASGGVGTRSERPSRDG